MKQMLQEYKCAKEHRDLLISAFGWVSCIGEQFFDVNKTTEDMVDEFTNHLKNKVSDDKVCNCVTPPLKIERDYNKCSYCKKPIY